MQVCQGHAQAGPPRIPGFQFVSAELVHPGVFLSRHVKETEWACDQEATKRRKKHSGKAVDEPQLL